MAERWAAVLPALLREHVEASLPDWVEPLWFASKAEALALAPRAQIGWFDMYDKRDMAQAIAAASGLRWLNSIFAGVDSMPLPLLQQRGVVLTNGAGINAITIAEYVLMGMLAMAKGYRQVVRAQDRHEWLKEAPGRLELAGSRALLLGHGGIGKLVQARLMAFDVEVTVVRRGAEAGGASLGPDQWRGRLADFDWIILAVPSTPETLHMLGAAEFAAMKRGAMLVNVARGSVVDQDALVQALLAGQLGGAFLDVTEPEPLPAEHVLWTMDNVHLSMHLSGRSQTRMFERSGQRFLDNLARWRAGQPLLHQVDLALGY